MVTYKPLLQSEIYSKVNQILKDKDSELNLIIF